MCVLQVGKPKWIQSVYQQPIPETNQKSNYCPFGLSNHGCQPNQKAVVAVSASATAVAAVTIPTQVIYSYETKTQTQTQTKLQHQPPLKFPPPLPPQLLLVRRKPL